MAILLSHTHPDIPLEKHLFQVASIAFAVVKDKGYRFTTERFEITNNQLANLVWIAAASHDIGKATPFFQSYIRHPDEVHDSLKNHSFLSSIFAYFVARRYAQEQWEDTLARELIPVLVLIATKRHHGNIENLRKEVLISNEQIDYLEKQINSIDPASVESIVSELFSKIGIRISWEDFLKFWKKEDVKEKLFNFCFAFKFDYPELREQSRISLFHMYCILYSALLFSDKNDVILEDVISPRFPTDIKNCLDIYREENGFLRPRTEINRIKNEAYDRTLRHLSEVFSPEQHLYSITLPTGLGKTLLALSVAEYLRKLTKNFDAKIVFTIPYTSIIDQNFVVYQEVVRNDTQIKTNNVPDSVLLKHHHLSDPTYKESSEKIYDYDKSQFLIETWQSEIIVTTFVQFLETVLSMDKTKLMKLTNLRNAVILLDEIQTIPYPLWESVRKVFQSLGKELNIYFVLISATQPLIFRPEEEIAELVPNYRSYFNIFNRTRLHIKGKSSFHEFTGALSQYMDENPQKNILVILNTKRAARECFQQLEDRNSDCYFLSTLITPYERKRLIRKIKEGSDRRKVIVSTQLVEAGVDISVDTVFRQLSPIDSLIQAAGRANRYNEKESISDVFIYEITGEFQKHTARIYGSDLMLKTKNALSGIEIMEEKEYLTLIERYFREVRKQSDETSSELLDAIYNLRFAEINLKLIEEKNSESVFIQLNEEAKHLWNRYAELCNDKSLTPWKRKARFALFKSKFYDYVINVPLSYGETQIVFDSEKIYGFYVSRKEQPSIFYSYSPTDFKKNIGYHADNLAAFF